MPWWLALIGFFASAVTTVWSYKSNQKAQETGHLKQFSWPFPRGLGDVDREKSPRYFRFAFAMDIWRTAFFMILTIVLAAYFVEAIGLLS